MPEFNLSILTPEGVAYEGRVQSVIAPGSDGCFGVLKDHAPMIAAIIPGGLKIISGGEEFYAVSNGVVEVHANQVNFLADHAEKASSNEDAIEKASTFPVK